MFDKRPKSRKQRGPNLEYDGNFCRSKKEKKGRLVGRKEKQNLWLFGFPSKAKDEIGHFNITSMHKKIVLMENYKIYIGKQFI